MNILEQVMLVCMFLAMIFGVAGVFCLLVLTIQR